MMEQAHDPEQQIAERYFLGELDDAQAEAFEAHYFDCPRCAEYVVETQMMFDAGREVLRTDPIPAPVPVPVPPPAPLPWRWQQWAPLAAAAVLAVVVGVQNIAGPPQQEAKVFNPEPGHVQFSLDRAEVTKNLTFVAGEPIILLVTAPQEASVGDEVVIRNAETQEVIPSATDPTLTLEKTESPFLLQPSALPAGRYEVVIERTDGNRRERIATQPFEVRR
jgi:hypothetical protein